MKTLKHHTIKPDSRVRTHLIQLGLGIFVVCHRCTNVGRGCPTSGAIGGADLLRVRGDLACLRTKKLVANSASPTILFDRNSISYTRDTTRRTTQAFSRPAKYTRTRPFTLKNSIPALAKKTSAFFPVFLRRIQKKDMKKSPHRPPYPILHFAFRGYGEKIVRSPPFPLRRSADTHSRGHW